MPCRISDELTLRHLPDDLSDDSLSFQIPSQADSSYLLDDITDDFFGATSDSINTPLPQKKSALHDPTPKPRSQPLTASPERDPPRLSLVTHIAFNSTTVVQVPQALEPRPAVAPNTKNPDLIPRDTSSIGVSPNAGKLPDDCVKPSTSFPLELSAPGNVGRLPTDIPSVRIYATNRNPKNLAVGVKSKESTDLPQRGGLVAPAHNSKVKSKPTVIGGRIAKRPKQTVSQCSNARSTCVPDQPMPESSSKMSQSSKAGGEDVPEAVYSRSNTTSSPSGGGVAQKFLLIGQRLMNSVTPRTDVKGENYVKPEGQLRVTEKQAQIFEPLSPHNDDPFTLSQLSPRKPDERSRSIQPTTTVPVLISPMRPSKKRVSAASEVMDDVVRYTLKKEETIDPDPDTGGHELRTLQSSRQKNGVPSTSSQLLAKRLKAKTVPPRQPPIMDKGKERATATISASRTGTKHGGSQDYPKADKLRSDLGRKLHASHPMPPQRQKPVLHSDKSSTTLPLPKPTMPIGFRFELDARMQDRNTEVEEKAKSLRKRARVHHEPVVIPNFKASHAAHGASLAVRKGQKTPIVPEGFLLNTEVRAIEREKFDEQVRAKQQENERQMEERRRQREVEEEKEIKELRKRAVPKAHQVPEWYANMPKRRGFDESA